MNYRIAICILPAAHLACFALTIYTEFKLAYDPYTGEEMSEVIRKDVMFHHFGAFTGVLLLMLVFAWNRQNDMLDICRLEETVRAQESSLSCFIE